MNRPILLGLARKCPALWGFLPHLWTAHTKENKCQLGWVWICACQARPRVSLPTALVVWSDRNGLFPMLAVALPAAHPPAALCPLLPVSSCRDGASLNP